MSETDTAVAETKPAKSKTVYTSVTMTDGRKVDFPGTRKTMKDVLADEAGAFIGVRFDYVSGETRTLLLSELDPSITTYASCHGLLQKVGDESSGVTEIDDIVLTTDEMLARLRSGSWDAARASGDSMAGASLVIKALIEASKTEKNPAGKTAAEIKAALDAKLEAGKEAGLTRQKLYASFRNPTSKVGQIIRRLEDERAAKGASVDADEFAASLQA